MTKSWSTSINNFNDIILWKFWSSCNTEVLEFMEFDFTDKVFRDYYYYKHILHSFRKYFFQKKKLFVLIVVE